MFVAVNSQKVAQIVDDDGFFKVDHVITPHEPDALVAPGQSIAMLRLSSCHVSTKCMRVATKCVAFELAKDYDWIAL